MPSHKFSSLPDVWAEIDLSAIDHNIRQLRSVLGPAVKMMAVVKANAYGHGLLQVSRRALEAGADCLGVARFHEAKHLRSAGINAPVLIFGRTDPSLTRELIENDLTQTVYSYETARRMSEYAAGAGGALSVHIKVDTGMGRLGILAGPGTSGPGSRDIDRAAVDEAAAISSLQGLSLKGVYTHFAAADHEDKSYAGMQLDRFRSFTEALSGRGVMPGIRHAANSGAIIDLPETHLDMVRAGISMYGLYPSRAVSSSRVRLRPAMALKARVIHLKSVGSGFCVSYGASEKTGRATVIATVSVGYADGYNRLLSSRGRMMVRGSYAPVIGRVCMDQTMLDVGHIPGVQTGDEVLVLGGDEEGGVPASEIADKTGTISYEVVSGISARVDRVYLG